MGSLEARDGRLTRNRHLASTRPLRTLNTIIHRLYHLHRDSARSELLELALSRHNGRLGHVPLATAFLALPCRRLPDQIETRLLHQARRHPRELPSVDGLSRAGGAQR